MSDRPAYISLPGGRVFPDPTGAELRTAKWRLRFAPSSLTVEERNLLASAVSAYQNLGESSGERAGQVVIALRRAKGQSTSRSREPVVLKGDVI